VIDDEEFLVFGSVADPNRSGDVGDIDLVLPLFNDDRRFDIMANLGAYEKLAAATGKPIDLFLTTWPNAINIVGWFDPKLGRWELHQHV
jgi:hypothetical protein